MRECLTCFCGGQAWAVFQDVVECERCGNEYPSYGMPNIALFNAARDAEHDQDRSSQGQVEKSSDV